MSGFDRYVSILRLFTEDTPELTVPEIGAALGTPNSSIYRTVRELSGEGFLEPANEAHYRLGAAFVEYDRLIRISDPLVRAGAAMLRDIIAAVEVPAVVALARLYGDRVICAVDEKSAASTIPTSYERGKPMPLTRGATSLAILTHLPTRRLRRLLEAEGQLGDIVGLRAKLADIKNEGFCITRGEVDSGLVGIAVPIHAPDRAIAASLSFVVQAKTLTPNIEERLLLTLMSAGRVISADLAS